MPTGYIRAVLDGIDFDTFAMRCARVIGYMDAPIPAETQSSSYHRVAAQQAHEKLRKLREMTPEQANAAAAATFDGEETRRFMRLQEQAANRAKYDAMLRKARDWNPPTPDHQGMKDFMLQELETTIEADCTSEEHLKTPKICQSGADWLAAEIAAAVRKIDYHAKQHAEEVERTRKRNEWLASLRKSLQR